VEIQTNLIGRTANFQGVCVEIVGVYAEPRGAAGVGVGFTTRFIVRNVETGRMQDDVGMYDLRVEGGVS
jgi:hypothetical protein